MNIRMRSATRDKMLTALRDALDSAIGAGTIRIFGGVQPFDGDTVTLANPLLAVMTISRPSGADAAGGVLTFGEISEERSAQASGVATWARIRSADDAHGFDCDVTGPGLGGLIELNTVDITAGGPVRIYSFGISMPSSME